MSVSGGVRFLGLLLGGSLLLALAPTGARTAHASTGFAAAAAAAADSFPHYRHAKLPCLTCHVVKDHARKLAFERPRGCDLCHHQEALRGRYEVAECARCHTRILQPPPAPVLPADERPVRRQFRHDRHTAKPCATCHVAPHLAPTKEKATCVACHENHHTARRDCAECHRSPDLADTHDRTTHRGCDGCHDPATIAALMPDRGLCLTCHEPQRKHQVEGECTTCHFLATPTEYQRYLRTKGTP
jgi:hypothetical protein